MRRAALLPVLLTTGCMRVDAIDQSAADCIRIMEPRVLAKAETMPGDPELKARSAQIEYSLYGGEQRLKAIQAQIPAGQWKSTKVEPQDEVNFGLILTEDAAGFRARAQQRVHDLCSFAEANRIQFRYWWLDAPTIADHTSQNAPVEPWS